MGVTDARSERGPLEQPNQAAEEIALARLQDASTGLWRLRRLDEGLHEILVASIGLLNTDMGNVQLLDSERAVLRIAAQQGFSQDFLDFFQEVSAGDDSACGRALRSGERIIIEDIEEDAQFAPLRPIMRASCVRAVQSTPLMGSDGRLLGVLSTHFRSKHRPSNRDLRLLDLYAQQAANFIERTRTDEQLRESEVRFRDSEARMRAIVDTAVDAILVINDDGLIGSANPAAEALFGYTAREMVGQNVKMLMPEPYAGEHDNYIRHYRQTGQRKIIGIGREVTGRRKDGSTFPMHLSVSECEIAGKCHFAGIIRDLTAREKAEADRLRQQTLFEATVNDAPQAIIVADPSRNIFLVNPAVSRIFAYAPPELIGQSLRVLYAGDEDYERIGRLAEQADATEGHAEPIRASFRRKNGELFPGELIATIIRDQQRNILGVMRFVRDISGQLKQEQVLRQNQRMDALGQLTGGIAHDFNNLLTVIMGSLELVEGSTDPQQTQHLVREANDAAKMGARLTNRLLSFSRQRKLEPAVVNLNELTSNVMDMLRRSIGETIAISTSLASNLRAIRVDPSEIENTILNLAVNSRDAMPHGGKLIIETQNLDLGSNDDCGAYGLAPGTYVRMSVSDTGTGMPPEVVARAFEPFFTTKPLGRGNGLGLASIYGFVKQSGGNATIYSEPGRGTTVHLYLPSIGTIEAVSRSGAQARSPTGTGETILVVEDNPQLRKLTLRRIELLGYRVLEADDGPSALAILDGEQVVQLIFSDVVMPGGMTGYELAQRAKERHPSIKVLLTSGYDAEQAAAQASTRSELRVLRKPYKQADLANALCAVLLS